MELNNQTTSTVSSRNNQDATPSFGRALKQARVAQGLSIKDIESELHILPRHLEALENEDFEALPQVAFSRGFVINYANLLGLDTDQIVRSFNQSYPETLKKKEAKNIVSPLRPMGTLQRKEKRAMRFNPLLILGVIGLIALAVFLWRMVANAQHDSVADEVDTEIISDSDQTAGAAINRVPLNQGTVINRTGNNNSTSLDNAGSAIETNVVESDAVQGDQ